MADKITVAINDDIIFDVNEFTEVLFDAFDDNVVDIVMRANDLPRDVVLKIKALSTNKIHNMVVSHDGAEVWSSSDYSTLRKLVFNINNNVVEYLIELAE